MKKIRYIYVVDNGNGKTGMIFFRNIYKDDITNLLEMYSIPLTKSIEFVMDEDFPDTEAVVDYKNFTIKVINEDKYFSQNNLELLAGNGYYVLQIGVDQFYKEKMKEASLE
ncbi:hypothetical protein [Eremococcus coleocola]|uniref:Uncharacterized protein n=1 Tax=Eremococcus coleocola ACS-139-V-Col8 TaxID=908337 RepID=E4KQF8_9LACT|nr:hypothetical protein [Eremococcus coleocola]EFR30667.1 hypothetical protein HMPREF9257_0514 [Eremococcus coleocola ACS-139-V-Col8]